MTITCKNYTAQVLSDGNIQLIIDHAMLAPIDDRLSRSEVARLLNKNVKSIDKLSRRKKDPLPFVHGKGRPFAFRSEVERWLTGRSIQSNHILRVFA